MDWVADLLIAVLVQVVLALKGPYILGGNMAVKSWLRSNSAE